MASVDPEARAAADSPLRAPPASAFARRVKTAAGFVRVHVKKHVGVGTVCAVAYFDPGNWGVDLEAGSKYGYRLLFVILLAGIFAVFLQVLGSRLGCITGLDLAAHCRLLLYNRTKRPRLVRWLCLYPLYVISEVAIIATDLAELLGSAIALCLLFPKLELWHGVLITAFDVIVLLALRDPLGAKPVRPFELLIAALVLAVLICLLIVIASIEIEWGTAFKGFIPSKYVIQNGALYTSVGILGATVMPHSLFLGSALATQDRVSPPKPSMSTDSLDDIDSLSPPSTRPSPMRHLYNKSQQWLRASFRAPPPNASSSNALSHADHENHSLPFIRAHLYHGIADIIGSLLGFAVLINSLILVLASAVFFYGSGRGGTGSKDPAGLFDAYDLIRDLVGKPAATLFAIALLAAGQSSSIIATVAGQAVSEGFLRWRVSAVVRRLLTRLIAVIPSMVVAVALGRDGVDTLLVASQVVLSVCLPFISLPLLILTSSKAIMSVREPVVGAPGVEGACEGGFRVVDFSSGIVAKVFGGLVWVIVVVANVYALVTL
ncbi:natural resistance-associated macrophage protein-domain-containing protein [Schizophyllum fasciatum]